ncbi:DUF1772 domain-containing protein [Hyphomicrobium sp. MC1]|uniref:DUF1772 domain-containing protein n=1 Tax=Hyphomicrobium sp. (strain MC1) TaxID=717785 RepID=UPI000213F01D|nr:DUF1772 domain-containing protein [Hyphomicrobium sp. MC1]CCB67912.1 conserved membrane protein of unknown function [Hyphomicrobium sp. MC1]
MFGPFALTVAALFTGAAIYINWAEQPARLSLDDAAMLAEWKPAYRRGFQMQASLAVIGFILGTLEWLVTGKVIWLAGGAALLANWPFTIFAIMPVNKILEETPFERANEETRALIERWGMLHGVRSVLGLVSVGLFLWASI